MILVQVSQSKIDMFEVCGTFLKDVIRFIVTYATEIMFIIPATDYDGNQVYCIRQNTKLDRHVGRVVVVRLGAADDQGSPA